MVRAQDDGSAAITAALQAYADRGVFRGFSATPQARGSVAYVFTWLTSRATHAVFDGGRSTLTLPRVFPGVPARSAIARGLQATLAARLDPRALPHRRIDRRRLDVTATTRGGGWSLAVHVKGANHALAVRTALGVAHEAFLLLQERYPEYLIEHFGLSPE